MEEFALIAELFAPLSAGCPGAAGLADDAAVLPSEPGYDAVLTMDTMVAGIHFLPDDPADLIARKLVRVNLSDLAAKGAEPRWVMLAAAFPRDTAEDWLRRFAAGLKQDLDGYGIVLIGGDTVSTPGPLTLTLTAWGRVAEGRALRRFGAMPDDHVWVSGTLGDGALGLRAIRGQLPFLEAGHRTHLAGRYRLPQPRVALGPRLPGLAHAAMDVSDGLVQDLGHLARASGLGAELRAADLPLSAAAAAAVAVDKSLLALPLGGGDDYELLFTAPPGAEAAVRRVAGLAGVPVARIGRMVTGKEEGGVTVLDGVGRPMPAVAGGWRHFS